MILSILVFKNGEAEEKHKEFSPGKRAFSKLKVYTNVCLCFFNLMLFILKMDGTEKMEDSPTDIQSAMFPAKHEQCSEQDTGKVTLVSPQIPKHPNTLWHAFLLSEKLLLFQPVTTQAPLNHLLDDSHLSTQSPRCPCFLTAFSKGWPTPVFWPGKLHGQRSLAGHSPRDCKQKGTTKCAHTHTHKPRGGPWSLTCLWIIEYKPWKKPLSSPLLGHTRGHLLLGYSKFGKPKFGSLCFVYMFWLQVWSLVHWKLFIINFKFTDKQTD